MKKVEAWQCDFCNKTSVSKGGLTNHERACKNNPARRNCITCVHGISIDPVEIAKPLTVESYMPGWTDAPYIYAGPWCDHHNMPISEKPYFVECDVDDVGSYNDDVIAGLRAAGIDVTGHSTERERPVPGTCFHYGNKGYAGWTKEAT
jgi:hypothetical protein